MSGQPKVTHPAAGLGAGGGSAREGAKTLVHNSWLFNPSLPLLTLKQWRMEQIFSKVHI